MSPEIQEAFYKALSEGRLFWCVTDQHGRPCNGGNTKERMSPPRNGKPGEWSPEIESPRICSRGYHVTTDPLHWAGSLVWLVEVDEVLASDGDKHLVRRRRALACVDPDQCIDQRIWAAASRPYLRGANLYGANLGGANLGGADLSGADLSGANLSGVNLRGAKLCWVNLYRSDLIGANLYRSDLIGANLYGANLGDYERGPDGYARRKVQP